MVFLGDCLDGEGLAGGFAIGFLLSLGGIILEVLLGTVGELLNTSRGFALGFLLLCTTLSPYFRYEGLS